MSRPPLDTTDVPGHITLTPGGVSRNIAENLARLGGGLGASARLRAIFIGVFGDDAPARSVIDASRAAGVDVRPIVRPGQLTASLAVVIDPAGRQMAGVFSGDILNTLTPGDLAPHLDVLRAADAIVTDGGAPGPVLLELARAARPGSLLVANPGSTALAPRLTPILDRCDLVTCNRFEAEALAGIAVSPEDDGLRLAQALVARGVKRAVVTLGASGLAYADAARSLRLPAQPARVIDATGAGDAMAAAILFSLLDGESIDAALALGLRAAALTCEVETSVSPRLSLDSLRARLV